jgi:hypothetical protein
VRLGDEATRLAEKCQVQRVVITLWGRTGADDGNFQQKLLWCSSTHELSDNLGIARASQLIHSAVLNTYVSAVINTRVCSLQPRMFPSRRP